MSSQRRTTRRSIAWLAVLVVFTLLLVLANTFTDGERFYGVAAIVTIALSLLGLFGLHRATSDSSAWRIRTRHIAVMALGAALYIPVAYVFDALLGYSIGQVAIRPQICLPVLLGYAFGPVVGFFSGAVGSLLGDFVSGWGVFPAWHIGSGLAGLMPGLAAVFADERDEQPLISALVIAAIALTASLILVHPQAPEPWTGEVQDFSFWGWALAIGGVVMLANSLLFREARVDLASLNLWGTLGLLTGNAFASLAHIWLYEYSLATAVIGEFAPAAATDILNLVVFAPLVLAAYRTAQTYLGPGGPRRH